MAAVCRRQRGIALLLFLLLMTSIGLTVALSAWNSSRLQRQQELRTQQALQEARAALIAYATSIFPSGNKRPGDLPCPDIDNDGDKETTCGSASGSTGQDRRLGRLPWKSLGLPDLRDATGERLWYAVSNNFKEGTRHLPLNSDTTGTIQVADANGTAASDVIAVIIAPGAPLNRLGDASAQDRSAGGVNTASNYLDKTAAEDNADFIDGGANGFVGGPVRDANGNVIVNDRLLVITYTDLMPLIEKQVANMVLKCLNDYAAYSDGVVNNLGRYPWPASMATSATGNYEDTASTLFGRVPNLMCNTGGAGSPGTACAGTVGTNPGMLDSWGAITNCTITENWFRDNWREQVFYAIADAFKPGTGAPTCGSCLIVNTSGNIRLAVFVGRRGLTGQDRNSKSLAASYLEGENATPNDGVFASGSLSATFNDLLAFR